MKETFIAGALAGLAAGVLLAGYIPNQLRGESPHKAAVALCEDNGGIGKVTVRLFANAVLMCSNGAEFDLTKAARMRRFK